jgi:hypothetical protein
MIQNEYDANGNQIKYKYEHYNEAGDVEEDNFFMYESSYDEYGNEINYISYNADGTIEKRVEYEYIAIEVPVK